MTHIKRALAVTAATGAGAAALMVAAPAASAAPSHAAYNGACGSGYTVVNSTEVGDKGTAYLTYSSATGKNCLAAIRNVAGDPVPMTIYLSRSDTEIHNIYDSGDYRSYAGPIYTDARGTCVDWWGWIGGVRFEKANTNCG
ncbi:spore-associated protein A [Streptomyces sp. DASNCL29]|uniref:spore-associated protein A n=1 Tax=Streptomyces sp. DASNCL29 TaxID=2583819 RepID=UPI00110FC5AD|nr:spore-associated protein A [Streptomyces sp. DASNCL29]TMU99770.1 spore-associated protein A [Streptomyces sp. DASNCL29]